MADDRKRPAPAARAAAAVPQTRAARLANLALAVGGLALGGLTEGVRRLAGGEHDAGVPALLTAANAQRLAERLARMRGAAMKLGQMLSLEGEDLLPPEFVQALAILRTQAAPMPASQLRRVLGREYGKGWEARFRDFDLQPLAAASIGQVHRVTTSDGRDLALKIQYPGVARSIRSDVENLGSLLTLLRITPRHLDTPALTAEAVRQLLQEADYQLEADALRRYARRVAGEPRLLVPRVHADLTTTRILAMDHMRGEALETLRDADVPQALRDTLGTELEHLMLRELFEFRFMQSDPHFGNYLWQRDTGRLVLLDLGSWLSFDAEFVRAYARITRAVIDDDRWAIEEQARAIGYLAPDDPLERVRATLDVIEMACEPLRHPGPYDFAASTLPARLRGVGLELGIRQGLLRSPPAHTLFLHRKLVGSFLMLARIGARVDARALVLPLLERVLGPRTRRR